MRLLLFLGLLLTSYLTYSQASYSAELSVNIKVRNDDGLTLEDKNVTVIFHFLNNKVDFAQCKGFQFSSHGTDQLKLVDGFSAYINTTKWKYESAYSDGTKNIFRNACKFGYLPPNSQSLIQGDRELILMKYTNLRTTFLVIGYDGVNTLVISIL